jgi:hypothetical protein
MAETTTYRNLTDCPADRFGEALRLHRETIGIALDEISKRVGFEFTPFVLEMVEAGRYPLDTRQVILLVWGYDAHPDLVLPIRDCLVVDNTRSEIAAGPTVKHVTETATPMGLLHEYLEFLYELRDVEPGSSVHLREDDLEVLSSTTNWSVIKVREHLTMLMEHWQDAYPHQTQSPTRTSALGSGPPVRLLEPLHQDSVSAS